MRALSDAAVRGLALVFVGLVFVAGIAGGVAVDRLWLLDGHGPRGGPHGHGPRGRPPQERFLEEITDELALDATQKQKVAAVLDGAQQRARSIMEASRPALDEAMQKTRSEVLEVLTPEQQARFLELEKQRPPRSFGPPPFGGGGPGMPPPPG